MSNYKGIYVGKFKCIKGYKPFPKIINNPILVKNNFYYLYRGPVIKIMTNIYDYNDKWLFGIETNSSLISTHLININEYRGKQIDSIIKYSFYQK